MSGINNSADRTREDKAGAGWTGERPHSGTRISRMTKQRVSEMTTGRTKRDEDSL